MISDLSLVLRIVLIDTISITVDDSQWLVGNGWQKVTHNETETGREMQILAHPPSFISPTSHRDHHHGNQQPLYRCIHVHWAITCACVSGNMSKVRVQSSQEGVGLTLMSLSCTSSTITWLIPIRPDSSLRRRTPKYTMHKGLILIFNCTPTLQKKMEA